MLLQASGFSLVLITAFISIIDLRFHRIPNISLLFLTLPLLVDTNVLPFREILLGLLIFWGFGLLFKVGMGDLKLLTILIFLQAEILWSSQMLLLFALVATFSLVIHLIIKRNFSGEIALAPAILIPFTLLYLVF
jgi:hypothetical protein